jgi:hypothetical protein
LGSDVQVHCGALGQRLSKDLSSFVKDCDLKGPTTTYEVITDSTSEALPKGRGGGKKIVEALARWEWSEAE